MTKASLHGLKVLVTRPESQARTLCEGIASAGGEAIAFPVIEILPVEKEQWSGVDLTDYNILIFVSRNAVKYFTAEWQQSIPAELKIMAVGAGTAQSMSKQGLRVDAFPESGASSETLLTLAELKHISGFKVLIVRGKGGRELLADSLMARGAKVDYLEVYQRKLPSLPEQSIMVALEADCMVVTSIAGLDNLCKLLAPNGDRLIAKPLLVISERIRQHAIVLGFKQVMVVAGASDDMVMQQLLTMRDDNEQ